MTAPSEASANAREAATRFIAVHDKVKAEVGKSIVGQEAIVEGVLTALFAGGHVLLEGVPGLAKTLLVSTLAQVLDLKFSRIQFTPDLMPSDITGTDVLETEEQTGHRSYRFIHGPVFANIVLADEISPDGCRLWDLKTGEKMDKDRFRRDLGNVMEAYEEVLGRVKENLA